MKQNHFILALITATITLWLPAQAQSIYFRPSLTWSEALKQAAKEKKLVFVDVYTDWCGPCKNMEENVFSLKAVGDFYNQNFLSYKLDAEKGEGIALKQKYGVKVYPTYLFIDPNTGNIVHKSTSRQDPDVFVFTGQSALDPSRQSVKLEQQYKAGVNSPSLLKKYADYLSSCYQRDLLDSITQQYLAAHPITDTLAWYLFSTYQKGSSSREFSYLLANRDLLSKKYGTGQVDKKIREGFEFDLNRVVMQGVYNKDRFNQAAYDALFAQVAAVDFTDKSLMLDQVKVTDLYRQQRYEEAGTLADKIAGYPGITKKNLLDFYTQMLFLSRNNEDLIWISHALNYARYIAYNDEEKRSKAEIHYNYATMLEKYLRISAGPGSKAVLKQPESGNKEYTLRAADLKQKPSKQAKVTK